MSTVNFNVSENDIVIAETIIRNYTSGKMISTIRVVQFIALIRDDNVFDIRNPSNYPVTVEGIMVNNMDELITHLNKKYINVGLNATSWKPYDTRLQRLINIDKFGKPQPSIVLGI